MSRFYPPLTDDALWAFHVIMENIASDPGYLGEECPYPVDFIELLEKKPRRISDLGEKLEEIDLEQEAHALFLELRESKDHLTIDDNAERMSYFRVATSLLDKLIGMRERANNVKRVSQFYTSVLGVMEEILEPDQITKVRNRLKEFVE
jgi:hypothetical protein